MWAKGKTMKVRLTEREFLLMYPLFTCTATARVTTARRYCIGSSGPSHLFCHVKGHWDRRRKGTERETVYLELTCRIREVIHNRLTDTSENVYLIS